MNIIIGLIGVAIFAGAIYGIVKHNRKSSTPSSGGHTVGMVIGGDASGNPRDVVPSNPEGREPLK